MLDSTCKIQTPVLGYVNEPFATGDKVFLEGVNFNNDGDGFNSGDYKFQNFIVEDYNTATNPRQVTFAMLVLLPMSVLVRLLSQVLVKLLRQKILLSLL